MDWEREARGREGKAPLVVCYNLQIKDKILKREAQPRIT